MSKFSTPVAEYIYNLSLDGTCEQVGSVQEMGHACLVEFDEVTAAAVNALLPEDERHGRCCWFSDEPDGPVITGYWGAILTEDGQGFVDVDLLPGSMEAEAAWSEKQHELDGEFSES